MKDIFMKHIPKFRDFDHFLRYLWPKQIDRQTNFKISDGTKLTAETTGKTKPFQQKKSYQNLNTCSKVMVEHPLKYIFHCIMYLFLP